MQDTQDRQQSAVEGANKLRHKLHSLMFHLEIPEAADLDPAHLEMLREEIDSLHADANERLLTLINAFN